MSSASMVGSMSESTSPRGDRILVAACLCGRCLVPAELRSLAGTLPFLLESRRDLGAFRFCQEKVCEPSGIVGRHVDLDVVAALPGRGNAGGDRAHLTAPPENVEHLAPERLRVGPIAVPAAIAVCVE